MSGSRPGVRGGGSAQALQRRARPSCPRAREAGRACGLPAEEAGDADERSALGPRMARRQDVARSRWGRSRRLTPEEAA